MHSRYDNDELYDFDFSKLNPLRIEKQSSANHRDIKSPFGALEHTPVVLKFEVD